MKRSHFRALITVIVINILIISYKILEPEVTKIYMSIKSTSNTNSKHYIRGKPVTGKFNGGVVDAVELDRRQAIVESLIQQYGVDYGRVLDGSPWVIADRWVNTRAIHPQNVTRQLGGVLHALQTSVIRKADVGYRGSQLKLSLILEGGQRAAFKPKWYARDKVFEGPYDGADRHNGEIAAFHLNRLLELNRSPLVVGRKINLRTEIMPVAEPQLIKTFFESGGNTCFYGRCYYCKGEADGVCGQGDILEGAIILWLPHTYNLELHHHPWARTYRKGVKARWEKEVGYCDYASTQFSLPHLLDLIDTAVFDHLIGNADRHHYEVFAGEIDSVVLLLDNAKSFGNPHKDEHSILAPLYQCCKIRTSLWKRLLLLQDGILSEVMKGLLENEPISPILTESHFDSMDRRLTQVMDQVDRCFTRFTVDRVLVDT